MTITDKQRNAAQDAYRKHVAEHGVEGSSEAISAALEAADAAAWETMETAPRDRQRQTRVLACSSSRGRVAARRGLR